MRDKSSNLLQKSISLHYGWEYKIISLLGMHEVTFVVFHLSLLDSFPSLFILNSVAYVWRYVVTVISVKLIRFKWQEIISKHHIKFISR